jgi:hypothetical protein
MSRDVSNVNTTGIEQELTSLGGVRAGALSSYGFAIGATAIF